MSSSSKLNLRKCGVVALFFVLPLLSACSPFNSGMYLNPSSANEENSSEKETPVKVISTALLKSQKQIEDKQISQDYQKLIGTPSPYKLEAGDILAIVVWGHPELAAAVNNVQAPAIAAGDTPGAVPPPTGFVIDHNGLLQFPFAGKLKLAGLTEEQARNLIATKISYYINKPNVTLRVQSFRSKRIYIDGEVKEPGLHPITDIPMTLVEAINRGGGFLQTADQSQISINRGGALYKINLPQMMQRGLDPGRIMLANGDVVRVPSRDDAKVFVAGEVNSPKALTMHNGRLTLNEALGESGGINPVSADGRQVYVVRKTPKDPEVYKLDATSPGAMAIAEGFELHPKDLIYVAATSLTNWHRTISLLFPGELTQAAGVAK
ncbi:MAG: polysaccharide biosynthesis/export family protein [Burkholderiaceae bacterium]